MEMEGNSQNVYSLRTFFFGVHWKRHGKLLCDIKVLIKYIYIFFYYYELPFYLMRNKTDFFKPKTGITL